MPSRSLPYVEAACSVTSTIQSIWVLHILSRLQAADALKPQAQASKLADPPCLSVAQPLLSEAKREERWKMGNPLWAGGWALLKWY